jgi:hypothetical protein
MDVNERTTSGGGKLSSVELRIKGNVPPRGSRNVKRTIDYNQSDQ